MSRLVASIRALLVAVLLGAPLPAVAATYADPAALDALFSQLKAAPDAEAAARISSQIWLIWFAPTVPALADQMHKSAAAMAGGDVKTAKSVLDQVVATYPDYAEGWNQRATLEYELGDLSGSLADIAQTLALEPRHFGALSGRVLIYLQQGHHADALKDMIAALAIDPYLSEKQLFPELQQESHHI
jgi:tetratricopeptide (TPR) repeat protein